MTHARTTLPATSPVYAAIAAHRAAYDAYQIAPEGKASVHASDTYDDASMAVVAVACTTAPEALALFRHLAWWVSALYSGAERRGREPHGPTLLRLVRRWLAVHEWIGALLPGIPEPPHVQQVRVVLDFLTERT